MTVQKQLNATTLKAIACTAMLIDHVGVMFFPQLGVLRFIGRIAFPIFAFFVCEGMEHTRNRTEYIRNLLLLALLSEPFFDLAFQGVLFAPGSQNTVLTLAIGAISIWVCERQSSWIFAMVGMVAGSLLLVDYGEYGVMLVMLFWYYRKLTVGIVSSVLGFTACFMAPAFLDMLRLRSLIEPLPQIILYAGVLLAVPLLLAYNGQRGGKKLPVFASKWSFYLFYPLHLAILSIFIK